MGFPKEGVSDSVLGWRRADGKQSTHSRSLSACDEATFEIRDQLEINRKVEKEEEEVQ